MYGVGFRVQGLGFRVLEGGGGGGVHSCLGARLTS